MHHSELIACFSALSQHYGIENWWPADTAFEMAVGAVLVQNTSWSNAEKVLAQLKSAAVLEPALLMKLPVVRLETLVKQSGTYRLKAARLRALAGWWIDNTHRHGSWSAAELRGALLAVNGIGYETADCIALYGFAKPRFIADAYARRLLTRLGLMPADIDYERTRHLVEAVMPMDAAQLGEVHALIVTHAKAHCRARPMCNGCPLVSDCKRIGVTEG